MDKGGNVTMRCRKSYDALQEKLGCATWKVTRAARKVMMRYMESYDALRER